VRRAGLGVKKRKIPSGPKDLIGSEQARRNAALVLESLSGISGPVEAARGMGVALARYYQLEARALQAFVRALEPMPRGRHETPEVSARKAAADRQRLARELHRYQALYRTAQKTLGLAPRVEAPSEEKGSKKKRRVRRVTRGERVAHTLRERAERAAEPASAVTSTESVT
jgi:hypothetical protein